MENNKILPNNREDLYAAYMKAGDINTLASIYELPLWFVKYELWYYDIIDEAPPIIDESQSRWPVEQLREDLRKYKTVKGLASHYNCDTTIVREALLVTGIFPKVWKRRSRNWVKSEIIDDINSGLSISELIKKYECSKTTFINVCKKFGIDVPSDKILCKPEKKFTKDELQNLYDEYGTITEIAKVCNCSVYKVWYWMNKFNVRYNTMKSDTKTELKYKRVLANQQLAVNEHVR